MPIATPLTSAIGSDAMPAMSATVSTRSNMPGPTPRADAPAGFSGANSIAAIAASVPAITQTSVEICLMFTAASRAASALAAEPRIASPYFVRLRNHHSAMTRSGMTMSTVSSSLRTMTPPMSQVFENGVGYGRTRVTSGRISWKNNRSCAAPIERDEQDDSRRSEETAHDQQFERRTEHRPDGDAGDEREPERDVPVDDEAVQERGGEAAHLADREVDDARRTEDQDHADGHHRVGEAGHRPREQDLSRDVEGDHAGSSAGQEDRTGEVVARRQFLGRPNEADLTLLHEHRTIGDRERDVQRLLDDDHRQALFLERADDLEHLLHDDRREPERELVDDEHLGFVQQRHREREHLLLPARQILRRRVAVARASIGKISSTRSMRRRCSRREYWKPAMRRFSSTESGGNVAPPPISWTMPIFTRSSGSA